MSTQFSRALLRVPGENFTAGITTSAEGAPQLVIALEQHRRYAAALAACGLQATMLAADPRFPDGCFVEDAAIATLKGAILTRPGAPARVGEIEAVGAALGRDFGPLAAISAPGTLDGGDVCETDTGVLIGLTARTNEAGARQLAGWLAERGYAATLVDVRGVAGLLHLKTGISYLGEGRLAVAANLPPLASLAGYELVRLAPGEDYAANCVRVNDRVLVAAGYPRFAEQLARLGYDPLPLEMSEFRKMDGGLSCLSVRF